jgi:HK97 gp10 family phage protein
MADIEIDIRGIAETQQAIYRFSEKLGDRVTLRALRAGANHMLKQVRAAEPVKTGRMKRATVVATSRIHRRRRDGQVGVYITVRKGKTRDDKRGAYYAGFVEHGYRRGGRQIGAREAIREGVTTGEEHLRRLQNANARRGSSRTRVRVRYRAGGAEVPGKHFIRDTFEATKAQSLDIIIGAIEQEGQRLAQEISNR